MLNVGSVSDVGVGFERCQAAGVNLKTRIGQHSNDEMISFYLTSPGGFEFEFATGGLEIDDANWTTRELREFRLWGYEPLG
jgi:3,4-dihydroxy-9,10-secoandrosta-1,3,5(10)-triene-9,17-dione 4,5-dioxygenase